MVNWLRKEEEDRMLNNVWNELKDAESLFLLPLEGEG